MPLVKHGDRHRRQKCDNDDSLGPLPNSGMRGSKKERFQPSIIDEMPDLADRSTDRNNPPGYVPDRCS